MKRNRSLKYRATPCRMALALGAQHFSRRFSQPVGDTAGHGH